MKITKIIVMVLCSCLTTYAANQPIDVGAKCHTKMKLLLVTIGDDLSLQECAQIMQNDFSFSGQLDVSIEYCKTVPSKQSFIEWRKQNYLLAVFINGTKDEKTFEWRIYDTSKLVMIRGKRYEKRGSFLRGWAHNMADMIWHELMGSDSSFSTKIAYSKDITGKKNHYRHIYVADYDGSNPQPLITTPTVNVAPRWNRDLANPLLFYSESSQANISLRVTAMDGRRKVASNFDGLNMLPTFSKDGKKVVYCISHGNGLSQLYLYEKGQLKQLISNQGNNFSTSLCDDGNSLFFCSDLKDGVPLIYYYDRTTGILEQITDTGPCFSPSYSEKNRNLAYIKRVNGIMQIFLYNVRTKEHRQFTTDIQYHKEECTWSPCGNYLLFCLTSGQASRIVIEHMVTHERRLLTGLNEHCSYPAWSPSYIYFPLIGMTDIRI